MEDKIIVVTENADSEFEVILGKGLNEFNEHAAGLSDRRTLNVIVRDSTSNEVLGGAIGRTSLGLAFLDLFYLPSSLRGSGLGTKILRAFEDEASDRGCSAAVLTRSVFRPLVFMKKTGG